MQYAEFHQRLMPDSILGLVLVLILGTALCSLPPLGFVLVFAVIMKLSGIQDTVFDKLWLPLIGFPFACLVVPSMNLTEALEFRDSSSQHGNNAARARIAVSHGIVHSLRQRRSKEPRDRAYALYSILQRLDISIPGVDYNKILERVYHEVMLSILKLSCNSLVLLLDAGYVRETDHGMENAPSWVPGWSRMPQDPTIGPTYVLSPSDRTWDATI